RTLAIYVDRSVSSKKSEKAQSTIITKTRIERLELKLKNAQIALEILKNELNELGFALAKEVEPKLLETMDQILRVDGQEGPWTIRQLAQDIVYNAFKTGDELNVIVDESILLPFLPGGTWLREFAAKKNYYMGLVGE
ncbi:MAG: hypothetical protein II467_05560, partial [Bacilli bacterium]|nr:hypothetical protein [Bacilli bacterium]